jgi:hypothetical protein
METKCAVSGCIEYATGKSKYCREHKRIARDKFIENIQKSQENRNNRELAFKEIYDTADTIGTEVAIKHTPTPMVVIQRLNPLDDSSPIVKEYEPIADGVCGFAWIIIKPGNCPFANWLKKHDLARKHYRGGVSIWISKHNQSYERKMKHAHAMAEYLQQHLQSIDPKAEIYAGGALD